jgi:hypothetical protein
LEVDCELPDERTDQYFSGEALPPERRPGASGHLGDTFERQSGKPPLAENCDRGQAKLLVHDRTLNR